MRLYEPKDPEPDQDPKRFGNAESGSRYEIPTGTDPQTCFRENTQLFKT